MTDDTKKIDMREVTRDSKYFRTQIRIEPQRHYPRVEIVCGRINLRFSGRDGQYGELSARAQYGVTDFEHDSAYVFRIPIVGVKFNFMDNGWTSLTGLLLGKEPEELRLMAGYNPLLLEGTVLCNDERCTRDPEEKKRWPQGHPIIPEGYYAGPIMKNTKLYQQLVGSTVEISTNIIER